MAATDNAPRSSDRWENLRRRNDRAGKAGVTGRLVMGLAGTVLLALSLRRKRFRPVLLPVATGLVSRALTGKPSTMRSRRDRRRRERGSPVASVPRGQGIKVERSVVINRPVLEVYRFWRNFENLPRFMDHLESVTVVDENLSHWVAKGPAGTRVEWDAVIHNEIDDELIAWRTLPGSEVNSAGSVHFTPTPAGNGTEVRVVLSYDPPAGRLGAGVARLLGEEPSRQVEDDLRRLKQVLDAREAPAGPRHTAGRA
ncbi:MAG: SRPBCC family protein [Gemmatimonadales bacterium]